MVIRFYSLIVFYSPRYGFYLIAVKCIYFCIVEVSAVAARITQSLPHTSRAYLVLYAYYQNQARRNYTRFINMVCIKLV